LYFLFKKYKFIYFAFLNLLDKLKIDNADGPKKMAYIPPHLRGKPPTAFTNDSPLGRQNTWHSGNDKKGSSEGSFNNGYQSGEGRSQQNWGRSSSRGGGDWYSKRGNNSGTGSGNYSPRSNDSYGYWKNGKHHWGTSNPRLEKELFGLAEDSDRQSTGINFDKYDDIPVETSGTDVPAAINTVSIILSNTIDYFNLFVFCSLLNSQLTNSLKLILN
jgi:ATP-dependent RNA helicase DDX3X